MLCSRTRLFCQSRIDAETDRQAWAVRCGSPRDTD